jgi:hypothetical protein
MTVTTTAPVTGADDLGGGQVLARVADAEQAERAAARDKLELGLRTA